MSTVPWLSSPRADRRPDSDGALLSRYVERRDDAAFALLVERHTPLVYRVCRAILRDNHDAEDATQATFLALAQTARSVRRRESVASWLHGTALRTAAKARTRLARDSKRAHAAARPEAANRDAVGELTVREARELLHAELDRLPDHYKSVLVLVYLEGMSHEDAAARLGWARDVFRGRLERARHALAARLARHKLTLSAALALTALTLDAPAGLASGIASAVAPAGHGTMGARLPLAGKAGVVIAAAGVAVAGVMAVAPPPSPPAPPPVIAAPDLGWHYHTGQVVTATEEGLFWLHPTGGAALRLAEPYPEPLARFRMAPDGRAVALAVRGPNGPGLAVQWFRGPATFTAFGRTADALFWTRDGARLVAADARSAEAVDPNTGEVWNAPPGYTLLGATAGENRFLALTPADDGLAIIDQGVQPVTEAAGVPTPLLGGLTREQALGWRLSPDGLSAAGLKSDPAGGNRVVLVNLQTRAETVLADAEAGVFLAWSPDSQAVLYSRPAVAAKGLGALVAQRLDGAPRVLPPAGGPPVVWADWR